jgi:trk system potassium uptake protein
VRVIVIGCGRVGAGLARSLSQRGDDVTVIDKDPAAFSRLGSDYKGKSVLGVGFDRDVLLRAGIERADALGAVTASDEANIVAGRVAVQFFHVPKVVARLYDPRKAEIYRRLGLQTIAPTTWGVSRLLELLSYSGIGSTSVIGNGDVDLVEAEVPPLLVGHTVNDVSVPGEITVAAISRGLRSMIPTLGTRFQAGDRLHLVVLATSTDLLASTLGLG